MFEEQAGGVTAKLVMFFKEEHPQNDHAHMFVTDLPIVTEVKPEQFWKAFTSISVTEFGMVTEVKYLQL